MNSVESRISMKQGMTHSGKSVYRRNADALNPPEKMTLKQYVDGKNERIIDLKRQKIEDERMLQSLTHRVRLEQERKGRQLVCNSPLAADNVKVYKRLFLKHMTS